MSKKDQDKTEREISDLEHFAELMFTDKELSVITGIPEDDIEEQMDDESGEYYDQISRGRLRSEAELRTSIFKMARNGSGPAQQMAAALVESLKLS